MGGHLSLSLSYRRFVYFRLKPYNKLYSLNIALSVISSTTIGDMEALRLLNA